jgi:hypothetical protein
MVSDSLTNNIATDTGKLYISDELNIFGEKSLVFHRISDITESKTINQSDSFIQNGLAVGLSIYIMLIFFSLKGRMSSISKMFVDYRFTKKQYEETSRITAINTTSIVALAIIVLSIQFSLLNNYSIYKMAIVSSLILSGILILQSAAVKLLALVCHSKHIIGEINLNRNLYLSILGIIILPPTVLALVYEGTEVETAALIVSKILLGIIILTMIIRLSKVLSGADVSYLFRFLYLCIFEISPYLALFIVF